MGIPASNRRYSSSQPSSCIVRGLAIAICLLGGILVIQTAMLIYKFAYHGEKGEGYISGENVTSSTSCGLVQGLVQNKSFAFLGIPYSVPPVKDKRWMKSQVHLETDQCWNGTYLANTRRKPCWQFFRNGSYDGDENCLFLDVYTPQIVTQNPIPVVVFLGGENLDGGESQILQPSAAAAKARNVVFVSVSIRRSVMGFLALKSFRERGTSGNYGISDLLTALLWVQRNIRYFGGNPESVTLLGHQSGSTIALALLKYARSSSFLFHKAWLSGGSFLEPVSLEEADQKNLQFLAETECENLDCLIKRSPEELLEHVPLDWKQFYYELAPESLHEPEHTWLVYDGDILMDPEWSEEEWSPQDAGIPVVLGTPADAQASSEMRTHLDWNITRNYREYLEEYFGTKYAIQAFAQYNRPGKNHWQQFNSLLSDYRTICPLFNTTRKFLSKNILFNYVTAHRSTRSGLGFLAHPGSDIGTIFNVKEARYDLEFKFRRNILSLFDSFVKDGSLPEAIAKSKSPNTNILILDDRITELQEYGNCDLWDAFSNLKKP